MSEWMDNTVLSSGFSVVLDHRGTRICKMDGVGKRECKTDGGRGNIRRMKGEEV